MVKAFNKKESKRMTCHKKYKIRKKVREHNKKLAKKLKTSTNKKKKTSSNVPNCPNLAPFKEDLLLDVLKQQEDLVAEKKLRKKQQQKAPPAVKSEKPVSGVRKAGKAVSGHVVLSSCDALLWVVDSRSVPESLSDEFGEALKDAGKPYVFILNKVDLVPLSALCKWYSYLASIAPTFLFKSTQIVLSECDQLVPAAKQSIAKHSGSKSLLGYLKKTFPKDATKVGVVGSESSGKKCVMSSILKSCGRTKAKQGSETKLNENIRLLTTPGLIESSEEGILSILSNLSRYMNYGKEVVEALAANMTAEETMYHFTLPEYNHPQDFLPSLASRYNTFVGRSPDLAAAGRVVLKRLRDHNLKFFVQCDEHPKPNVSIPSAMLAEVQDFLWKGDALPLLSHKVAVKINVTEKKKKKYTDMETEEDDNDGEEEEDEDDDNESDDEDEGNMESSSDDDDMC